MTSRTTKDKLNILNNLLCFDIAEIILSMISFVDIHRVTPQYFKNEKNKNLSHFDERIYTSKEGEECSSANECYECTLEKYEQCMGYTYIICPQCENKTKYGVLIDYIEQHISYECNNCNGYFTACRDCYDEYNSGNLMELKEHFTTNKISKSNNYEILKLSGNDYKTITMHTVQHIKYIKPVCFYNEKIFGDIIGPCGGYLSIWNCKKHDKEFMLSDK